MFKRQTENTKSMKGIRGAATRLAVIMLSFMMAIQVIPFSMYDGASYATSTVNQQPEEYVRDFVESPYVADGIDVDDLEYSGIKLKSAQTAIRSLANTSSIGLPSKYDLRDVNGKNYVTSLKDQGDYATCWSFASVAAAESSYIRNGGNDSIDLSELQLAWFMYNNIGVKDKLGLITGDGTTVGSNDVDAVLNRGGNPKLAALALASGIGFAAESKMPYDEKTINNLPSISDKNCYDTDYMLTASDWYAMSETQAVKRAIKENGALAAYCYINGINSFYDNEAYTDPAKNHAVTIIGWDDDYDRNNFANGKDGKVPSENGAWLVKSSSGAEYGWISYEEYSLSSGTAVGFTIKDKDADYDIFQYDGSSNTATTHKTGSKSCYFDAVYETDKFEDLHYVGLTTYQSQIDYEINIYTGYSDVTKPTEDGTSVYHTSGTLENAGYHLVAIDKDVQIPAGGEFAVVVKYSHDTEDVIIPVDKTRNGNINHVNDVEEGQTYYSKFGSSFTDYANMSGATARLKVLGVSQYSDDLNKIAVKMSKIPSSSDADYSSKSVDELKEILSEIDSIVETYEKLDETEKSLVDIEPIYALGNEIVDIIGEIDDGEDEELVGYRSPTNIDKVQFIQSDNTSLGSEEAERKFFVTDDYYMYSGVKLDSSTGKLILHVGQFGGNDYREWTVTPSVFGRVIAIKNSLKNTSEYKTNPTINDKKDKYVYLSIDAWPTTRNYNDQTWQNTKTDVSLWKQPVPFNYLMLPVEDVCSGTDTSTTVEKTYNGQSQTNDVSISNVTKGENSVESGTNVGSYTATYTPNSNAVWVRDGAVQYSATNSKLVADYYFSTRTVTLKINKAANPLAFDPSNLTCTYSPKQQDVAFAAATGNQGTLSYSIPSQKNGSGDVNYFTIASGKLRLAKGTPAGDYKVKLRASAAGNSNYNSKNIDKEITVTVNKADPPGDFKVTAKHGSILVEGWTFPQGDVTFKQYKAKTPADASLLRTDTIAKANLIANSTASTTLINGGYITSAQNVGYSKYLEAETTLQSVRAINTGNTNFNVVNRDVILSTAVQAPYTTTFNSNGAGSSLGDVPETQIKREGINSTLPEDVPTRTGYTFDSWNTAANGTGTKYAKGATYKYDGNQTLYAQWIANKVNITYDYQGGAHGSKYPSTITYDVNTEISNPVRTGYTFAGWKITGMDSGTHTIGDGTTTDDTVNNTSATTFKNLHATKGATVTFQASWTPNEIALEGKDDISYITSETESKVAYNFPSATNGTGQYTYTEISEKDIEQNPTNYFTVATNSGNKTGGTITAVANTPKGTYKVTVQAKDNETNKTITAEYSIKVQVGGGNITIDKSELDLTYGSDNGTINVTFHEEGSTVQASSKDESVVKVSVEGEVVTVIPQAITEPSASAIVEVMTEETGTKGAAFTECIVTVHQGVMTITKLDAPFEFDNQPHNVQLQSDKPGTKIYYIASGDSNDYDVTLTNAEQPYTLAEVSRTSIGTTAINYTATLPGYLTVTDTINLTIEDTTAPEADILNVTEDVADHQTITLGGGDLDGLAKYYFGDDASGEPDKLWSETSANTEVVSSDGTYYLIVQDKSGNNSEPLSVEFYKTTLVPPNEATVIPSTIITRSGRDFRLPELATVPQGYHEKETGTWKVGDTEEYIDKGGLYTPQGNCTLTGSLEPNEITLENVEAHLEGSEAEQYVDIIPADNGTGAYTYSIDNQPRGDYFELVNIDDVYKLKVSAKLPGGSHIVKVKVYDENSHVQKIATYIIYMSKTAVVLDLDKYSIDLTYPEQGIVTVAPRDSEGELSVKSDDKNIATATLSGDSIIVTPGKEEGSTYVTVKIAATNIYDEAETSFDVNVHNGNINVTPISCEATANGIPHFAKIKTDVAGAEVRYGSGGKYNHVLEIVSADTPYDLSEETLTDPGTKVVNYKVSAPGYNTVEGSVTITVRDTTTPTVQIKDLTHKATETQSATLTATDAGRIQFIYFGPKKNPTEEEYERLETPLTVFERQRVEVSGAGAHYFIVKDVNGAITRAKIDMQLCEIVAENGTPSVNWMLVQKGVENELPTVVAHEGYLPITKWHFSTVIDPSSIGPGIDVPILEDFDVSADGTLVANTSGKLIATCGEKTATLTYSSNGKEAATAEAQTMYYSKEATAAAAISAEGFAFEGWNTRADGKGTFIDEGGTVKAANKIPEDTTLYAIWSIVKQDNALTLSSSDATIPILGSVTLTIDNPSGGELSVSSNKPGTVYAELSGNTVTITSVAKPGEAVITVTSQETDLYNAATATCNVTVIDTDKPEATYTTTNNVANKQTITFVATDSGSGVESYYYGTKLETELEDNDFEPVDNTGKLQKSFEVNESGTYLFVAKDKAGNSSDAISVQFHKTTFTVTNGSVATDFVITENDKSFSLPSITPNENFKADGIKWKLGETEYAPGSSYTPSADAEFTATCVGKSLDFEGKTIPLTASSNAQTVNIEGPTTGSGNYEYELVEQSEGDYLSLEADEITVAANTPGGNHMAVIKATDTETSATATATYMFNITKMTATITLSSSEATVVAYSEMTVGFTKVTDGTLSVESNSVSLVTAELVGDSIKLAAFGNEEEVVIVTVTAEETGLYKKATATLIVHVKPASNEVTGSIVVKTNNVTDKQTVEYTAYCETKIAAYYFGTDRNAELNAISPVTELTKTVEVDEAGKYYFIVRDLYEEKTEVATVRFYETKFQVTNGGVTPARVITEAGKSFNLPAIEAVGGYEAPATWSNGIAPGAAYTPNENSIIKADCLNMGETAEIFTMKVNGHSLTINEDLTVNFYFDIPRNFRGGTMTFTVAHDGGTQEVAGEYCGEEKGTRFSCKLNVNQMSEGITWSYAVDDKTAQSEEPYSFYDYLNEATSEDWADLLPELAAFADSLKAYGYYAQNFLSEENHFEIGTAYEAIPEATVVPDDATSALEGYNVETTGNCDQIGTDPITQSLVLDNSVAIKLYIPLIDGTTWTTGNMPEITVDGTPVASGNVTINGGNLEIIIPGVNAIHFDTEHEVVIDGDFTVTTTALAYAKKLKQQDSNFAKKLGDALYDLFEKANDYWK